MLFMNVAGAVIGLLAFPGEFLVTVILSCVYFVLLPFFFFFMFYWSLYKATSTGNSLRYILFFLAYFVGILFNLIMVAGVPQLGSCGIVGAVGLLSKYLNSSSSSSSNSVVIIAMVYMFIMGLLWLANALFMIIMVILNYKNFMSDCKFTN